MCGRFARAVTGGRERRSDQFRVCTQLTSCPHWERRVHRLQGYCSIGSGSTILGLRLVCRSLNQQHNLTLPQLTESKRCLMLLAPANHKYQGRRSSIKNRFRTFAAVTEFSLHLVYLSWASAKSSTSKSLLQKRVFGF